MKVNFDSQIFSRDARGGIANYFAQLATELPKNGCQVNFDFHFTVNEHYFERGGKGLIKIPNIRGGWKLCQIANKILGARSDNSDVWHSTHYDHDSLIKFKERNYKSMVCTIHDMIPELYPDLFGLNPHKSKLKYAIEANQIIAVSQNTKRDIIRLYGIEESKITVVHHGIEIKNMTSDAVMIPDHYIIFIGGRGGYKNFSRFATAYSMFRKKNPEFDLICVGGGKFTTSEQDEFSELGITPIHYLKPTDSQIRFLLRHANQFVYSSLYEGFGIPILEAMAQNCVTVLSNASCFPEIARDGAIYFDPLDIGSIHDAIDSAAFNTEYREIIISEAGNIFKEYSIEKMVKGTIAAYHKSIC